MKYSFIIGLLSLCFTVTGTAEAIQVTGDGDATITAGEKVDINWDWQNVENRRATNNYGDAVWTYNPVPAPNKYSYPVNYFTIPGVYSFRFDFQDDDSATTWYDQAWLTVLPAAPVSLNSVSVNGAGTVATLTWSPGVGASGARVRVTDPASVACPTDWVTISATVCERVVAGNSTTFGTTPNEVYAGWIVYSRASTLESLVGTSDGGFTANATSNVQLNFR
jgi:hypothetical protein